VRQNFRSRTNQLSLIRYDNQAKMAGRQGVFGSCKTVVNSRNLNSLPTVPLLRVAKTAGWPASSAAVRRQHPLPQAQLYA
jgi:hypothetical protein